MAKYNLTVTGTQLRLIWASLEEYERLRMGQFSDFTDEIAEIGCEFDWNNHSDRQFDVYINRRNGFKELCEAAYRRACPRLKRKTEKMLIAEDMWTAIRHHLWMERPEEERKGIYSVASYPPLHCGNEPMIKIERAE